MLELSPNRLRAVSDAYRFLSLFLSLPDEETAEGVVSGDAAADLESILREMGVEPCECKSVAAIMDEDIAESPECVRTELRRDFTRLFTNPEKPLVGIYEASFKDAGDFDTSKLAFVSPTAIDAEKRYRAWGLAMGQAHRESCDHMGAEVDFLAYLYAVWAEAVEAQQAAEAERAREAIVGFMDAHFLKWADPFFEAVGRNARTASYRAVGALGVLVAREGQRQRQAESPVELEGEGW